MSIPKRLRAILALLVIGAFAVYGFLPAVSATGNAPPKAEADTLTNACAGIFTPGYWKNYSNHFTDQQFYNILIATQDFGPTFQNAGSVSAADQLAVNILSLPGKYFVRELLDAEINVAASASGSLGGDFFTPQANAGTVNQLLHQAWLDNGGTGGGNVAPYTNSGSVTPSDQQVVDYLSGGGENKSANDCEVQSSNSTATPTASPTNTPSSGGGATSTPTSTPTIAPTNTPSTGVVNDCAGIFTPGYWKNYSNHFTDQQFYNILIATQDFGPTFQNAGSVSAADQLAVNILSLPGKYFVRELLDAEINVAASPILGTDTFVPLSGTVNTLLHQAYLDNASGNVSPYTNSANVTPADQQVVDYLSGGGENASANDCEVQHGGTATPTSTPTNTPTSTPTTAPTNTPTDTPTATPTSAPTNTPTSTPTDTPTPHATDTPTATPTSTPTSTPTPNACTATSDTITGTYVLDNGNGAFSAIANQAVWIGTIQNGSFVVDTSAVGSNNGGQTVSVGEALTDSSGAFSFSNLQPGSYVVRAAIKNGYGMETATVTLNGTTTVMSPANTSDVNVTLASNCDHAAVSYTIVAQACAPILTGESAPTTLADGHQGVTITLQDGTNGGGLANIQLTGTNANVYSINGQQVQVGTPPPATMPLPVTINLTTPQYGLPAYPASVSLVVEVTSGTSGYVTSNALDKNGCNGDPAALISTRSTGQPQTNPLTGLNGQETTITVNNNGVTNIQLVLGGVTYQLTAGGTPGTWQGTNGSIALNGTTTLPIPAAALGATTGSVTDLGQPGNSEAIIIQ